MHLVNPFNHVYIWQVSLQLNCGTTFQIWTWYSIGAQYCDNSEKSENMRDPDRPGEKLHSPPNFFIHGPIFPKFGTDNHGDQRPSPSKFEPNPTTLTEEIGLVICTLRTKPLSGPIGNVSEIWILTQIFMQLEISSGNWQSFCSCLNVLHIWTQNQGF